jgi:hypothetical protein
MDRDAAACRVCVVALAAMSMHPTKPNQRCRVVGGRMAFNGEGKGPNQGKEVVTVFKHDQTAGVEQENVWRCRAKDGDTLQTYYGAGTEADFLECWLQVIDEQPVQTGKLTTTDVPA